jgi:hypothetical protein
MPVVAQTHVHDNFLHHSHNSFCIFDANDDLFAIDCDSSAIEYFTVSNDPILVRFFAGLKSEPESYHFILRAPPSL